MLFPYVHSPDASDTRMDERANASFGKVEK